MHRFGGGVAGAIAVSLLLPCSCGTAHPARAATAAALSTVPLPAPTKPEPLAPNAALNELGRRLRARFPRPLAMDVAVETGMHQTDVTDADVDAAETFAVTTSKDKTARVWALDTGEPRAVLRVPKPGQSGELFAVAVAPAGDPIAIGGLDGRIYLFETKTWRLTRLLVAERGGINALRYSRDGKRLAAGFHGRGGLSVFETAGYTRVFEDRDFAADIYGVAFSETGQLAVASWDRTVRLYSATHELLAKQSFATRAHRVAFDPSGQRIVVGFLDQPIARVLTLPKLELEAELGPSAFQPGTTLGTVGFARDGSQIFASGRYATVARNPLLRWARDLSPLQPWFLNRNTPSCLLGLKGGGMLLTSQDPLVARLDASGGVGWAHIAATPSFVDQARSLRASGDGSIVEFAWGRGDTARLTFDIRHLSWLASDPQRALAAATNVSPRITVEHWHNYNDPTLAGKRLSVEPFETCRTLSIAAAERFLLGCEWGAYLFDDSGHRRWRHGTLGATRAAYLTADARIAVVALEDGSIRWLNGSTGEELVAVSFYGNEHDWVAWTPQGFFTGTPRGERLLGLQMLQHDGSAEFLPLQPDADLMRRPDLVSHAIDHVAPIDTTPQRSLASL